MANLAKPNVMYVDRCQSCGSSASHMHPAVQHEGEVEVCADTFHLRPTPQNTPEYIAAVERKRASLGITS